MKNVFYHRFQPALSLYCLLLILSCFHVAIAEERTYDPSQSLIILDHKLSNAHLTEITEDLLIIDGAPYRTDDKTQFLTRLKSGGLKSIPMDSISLPCRVTINYQTFSVYTEAFPYHGDERLLVRVVVKIERNQRSTP
ncbi:MAG: hypothetical protein GY737_11590 [Desulfobacteraceae bacterium]|nr:hypothetical protein [Desulfobacteraceae bacterium]